MHKGHGCYLRFDHHCFSVYRFKLCTFVQKKFCKVKFKVRTQPPPPPPPTLRFSGFYRDKIDPLAINLSRGSINLDPLDKFTLRGGTKTPREFPMAQKEPVGLPGINFLLRVKYVFFMQQNSALNLFPLQRSCFYPFSTLSSASLAS